MASRAGVEVVRRWRCRLRDLTEGRSEFVELSETSEMGRERLFRDRDRRDAFNAACGDDDCGRELTHKAPLSPAAVSAPGSTLLRTRSGSIMQQLASARNKGQSKQLKKIAIECHGVVKFTSLEKAIVR